MCDCNSITEEEVEALIAAAVAALEAEIAALDADITALGAQITALAASTAAALYAASGFRVITGAGATKALAASDFPDLADPRPTLIVLGAATTSVVIPASLTLPVGAFCNFLQGSSQATFSVSGGAVLSVPLATENKSGGANTQQVVTQTANDTWVLGGRTSV